MHKILFIALTTLLSTTTNAQTNINMVVGTYTNGSSEGVYSLQFNQITGRAMMLDSVKLTNPSYLTISKNGKTIYAVSEVGGKKAALNAISFNATNGKMQLINTVETHGSGPCFVESNGKVVLTANYGGGNFSTFPILNDGKLGELSQLFTGKIGGSVPERQTSAHIHCVKLLPNGKGFLATDFSSDRILRILFKDNTTFSAPTVATKMRDGSGPRHIIFSKNGKFAYVISELSGAVTVFKNKNGMLKQIQEIQSDEVNAMGAADIHLTPNGKFLYSSNRLKQDGLAIFKVNSANGKLTKVGYQLTGKHPRNFNITPNGKFLLCASRDDNKIQVFSIQPLTGQLTDTQQDICIDKPVCIQFHSNK